MQLQLEGNFHLRGVYGGGCRSWAEAQEWDGHRRHLPLDSLHRPPEKRGPTHASRSSVRVSECTLGVLARSTSRCATRGWFSHAFERLALRSSASGRWAVWHADARVVGHCAPQ